MELGLHVDELTWPSPEELRESPVASFGRVVYWLLERLTGIGWNQPRLVLLVDEFTYLYEYIREGIIAPTFMRNWKALLQEAFFSAVVVGQDSMPRFKQEFANEFGSTFDERLNYLAPEEAKALAEEPILLKGGSRYRGRALVRLQDLTAGSPFYTHIFCDRLVRHLNLRRAPFITEADIEEVAEGLVSGQRPLEIERFDPLITAAGESVAEAPRSTYLDVLTAIAASRGGARFDELPQIENLSSILKDLIEREAVMIDAGQRYSIRVGIFAQWLRVNRVRGREL